MEYHKNFVRKVKKNITGKYDRKEFTEHNKKQSFKTKSVKTPTLYIQYFDWKRNTVNLMSANITRREY